MSKKPKKLSFEEWVKYVFDHPVKKRKWYWKRDLAIWDEDSKPFVTLTYLTQLFENPVKYIDCYTGTQLNQGLWFLVDNSCSNHMFVLLNEKLELAKREHCISAIFKLFECVFANRCSSHLSHLDEPGANPLNLVCYMWWDLFPTFGNPKEQSQKLVDAKILEVMEEMLSLKHDACRESVLHGLGHWQMHYPQQVQKIIDDFLTHNPRLRPELKAYAEQARMGMVL